MLDDINAILICVNSLPKPIQGFTFEVFSMGWYGSLMYCWQCLQCLLFYWLSTPHPQADFLPPPSSSPKPHYNQQQALWVVIWMSISVMD